MKKQKTKKKNIQLDYGIDRLVPIMFFSETSMILPNMRLDAKTDTMVRRFLFVFDKVCND